MDLEIIMYHYVHDTSNYPFKGLKGITPEYFRDQIESLLRWGKALTLQDLISILNGEKNKPNKAFYLTFDDGLKDHYNTVFPILQEYNLTGSFYPLTRPYIDKKIPTVEKQRFVQYCFYEDYFMFLYDFYSTIETYFPETFRSIPLLNKENIKKSQHYLKDSSFYSDEERFYRYLRDKHISCNEFVHIIDILFKKYFTSEKKFIETMYISENELKEIKKHNMDIGSHTHSHPFLPNITKEKQEFEINNSINFLSNLLEEELDSFCYPFGAFNEDTIEILKKQNIKIAFSTENYAKPNVHHPLKLYRFDTINIALDNR